MAATSYYGWVPPSVEAADFNQSNCGIAAQWLSAYVNSRYNGTDNSDPPMLVTYEYILAVIPSGLDLPTFGQAAQWIGEDGATSDLYQEMAQFPYGSCPAQICKALVWEGDADLSGIGVMVVYYLAAIFATMYFVLLAADQWEPFRNLEHHHRRWKFVVGAFHETVQSFLDTGLIFSIAMLIASVYRHGESRLHPNTSHSLYELTNATYIGIFSIFPPVLLQIVSENKRRRRIRATLWFIVIALAVSLVALYFNLETSATNLLNLLDRQSALSDVIWEFNCEPLGLRNALDNAIITACVLLIINFFPWIYHTAVPSTARHRLRNGSVVGRVAATKPDRHGRTWWKNVIAMAKTIDGILCCFIMWALLVLFTTYRSTVLDRMGPDNGDIEWSFAQVFALATWVPVAIDLTTIYIYGAQDALEGKVSQNFRVVVTNEKMRQGSGDGDVVDYSNIDPFQVIEPEGQYGVNTQYVGAGGQYNNNIAHYGGETGHGGQYAAQYNTSMSKEAVPEAQPMTTSMQPAPYNYSSHSQPAIYEYVPQDPAVNQHGGSQQ